MRASRRRRSLASPAPCCRRAGAPQRATATARWSDTRSGVWPISYSCLATPSVCGAAAKPSTASNEDRFDLMNAGDLVVLSALGLFAIFGLLLGFVGVVLLAARWVGASLITMWGFVFVQKL